MSLTALPPSDRSGASPDKSLSLRFLPDRGDLALQVYSLLEKPVILLLQGIELRMQIVDNRLVGWVLLGCRVQTILYGSDHSVVVRDLLLQGHEQSLLLLQISLLLIGRV
jgi:hypothetical protein